MRSKHLLLLLLFLPACTRHEQHAAQRVLRVCSDPNNLPFSNVRQEGFENKIASLIANEMHAKLEYTWWAQRRGFIRSTLKGGLCDLVIGVPTSFELARTTIPYYRSSYVFVTRHGEHQVQSFNDPFLRKAKIGVQLIGDDYANTPPVHALSNRGITGNLKGYTVYGDYRMPNPPSRIVDAVANGDVDVAILWGPFAGYFAKREKTPLDIHPVSPQIDVPFLPFVYDISLGVRSGDDQLRLELNEIIKRRERDIKAVLDSYGVPQVDVAVEGEKMV